MKLSVNHLTSETMPRVAGSLVTDADLNGAFPPKAGYTPTTENTLILSADVIISRYNVIIAGGAGLRCPTWDQITVAATTAAVSYEMLLMSVSKTTNYIYATVNGVQQFHTGTGNLTGTINMPLNVGSCYVTLVKQGLTPHCSLGVYDTTGGGRIQVFYYEEVTGTQWFDMIGGKTYKIEGYAGTGIP